MEELLDFLEDMRGGHAVIVCHTLNERREATRLLLSEYDFIDESGQRLLNPSFEFPNIQAHGAGIFYRRGVPSDYSSMESSELIELSNNKNEEFQFEQPADDKFAELFTRG